MWIVGISLAVGAGIVVWLLRLNDTVGRVLDGLAAIAFFVFAMIAGDAVRGILVNNTVFMTEVHRIFLNYWFLASGAYLGIYVLARLVLFALRRPS